MSAIGGKWSLILLYWLDGAPRRFNELQRLVPDISHKSADRGVAHTGAGRPDHARDARHAH
ncbi:MAG: winged helix-turn-helix transcriptional regulator [Caulobacteraceae bacterium]